MKKFQKIQQILSVVPFLSTLFVIAFTITELIYKKASKKIWGLFALTIVASGITIWIVNAYIMTGEHLILNVLVSALLLVITNLILVELQKQCDQLNFTDNKTFKKQIIICSVIVGISVCVLFVVATIVAVIATSNYIDSFDIDDVNGARNTNLAVIRHEEVISTNNSAAMSNAWTQHNGNQTKVTGVMDEHDYDECMLKCKKISGIIVVQATKTNNDYVVLEISSEVVRGNMEIFIVLDGQIFDCVPVNQTCSITVPNTAGKTLLVKVAAESAEMKISVKRKTLS